MIKFGDNSSFYERFVSGEAQYASWGAVSKGFGFLNALIIVTSLTLYQYGVFQLVLSLYGFAAYLTSVGDGVVNNDITHFIREKKEGHAKKLFYEYNSIRFFLSGCLWASFFFGATLFEEKYSTEFVNEIRIISFLFLTEVFFSATESLLATRLSFSVVASRLAFIKIAQFAALLFFMMFNKIGLREIFLAMIFGSLLSTITMIPVFFKLHNYWAKAVFPKEKMLLSIFLTYGKWDVYRQFFSQITTRIQPWLIKIFVSTEAVAIFSIATAFIGAIKDFGLPVKTLKALVPLYLDDVRKIQKTFVKSLRYMLLLSVVVSVGAFVLVPVITKLFLPQYIASLTFFYVMLIGIPFSALGIITGVFIVALRKQKFLFLHTILRSFIMLLCYVVFLPTYGLWALAAERVVTPFAMFAVTYLYMIKIQPGVTFRLKELFNFGKEDWEFVKKVYNDLKRIIVSKFSYGKTN